MIRINSIHKLALAALAALALGLGGCAAQDTDHQEDGQSEDEFRGAHLVRINDGRGESGDTNVVGTVPSAAHPASAQGPQPDPWRDSANTPSGGPQPDPWNPSRGDPNAPSNPGGPDDR